ncbi:ring-1,2-phenylacetyl-CoA epoxidase subunit PaaC [Saccharopolyspora erythraea NRRL 2338]|uniref:Phenylacetic acid degradation protein n=3 Tax=Saccharopolyspora erythraea TaxID=1836 RepID=A4FFJ5_SACEN|nr:1,2-phenylacetyl-CoA epoxidase subunit PaaC [Saccharopolyspora erythraea]PFG96541.1 ring-1,2-phenylacetyl-CoA epoxidase subunit PaaC [Saccharopolyspora erythraea NRRL 2338]QRK93031.1 phenylacetate-CoA oxygenase subunit PaaC [Saccharopolyspora erythraea]CAM02820.1 putative phenylacetic acid degradation protein [Saccharopolyspora erythraea NRRL 2338]
MSDENAYQALTEAEPDGESRWAFGTGFDDPLSGVDTTLPDGVDGAALGEYCTMLGDDALVLSHRLTEWVTNAPELEDELALANIALDLLGQARLLLSRAGQADGSGRGEDELAYFREDRAYRNVRLVEVPNGDFAETLARLLVFSTWRLALFSRLADSRDPVVAAIAAKGVKELAYHREYAARWVVRLGDGTELSHERMRAGIEAVWPFVDELFTTHDVERRMTEAGAGVDPAQVRAEFDEVLAQVLRTALLPLPEIAPLSGVNGAAGRDGIHTEHLAYLLAEMQSLARAHPEATW